MTPDRHYFDNVLLISEVLQKAHSRSGAYTETLKGGGETEGMSEYLEKNTILVKSLITDYPKRGGGVPSPPL